MDHRPVAEVLPEQVGVALGVERRIGASGARGPLEPLHQGKPPVATTPVGDRRPRQTHRPCDICSRHPARAQPAGLVDEFLWMHAGMVSVTTDKTRWKVPPVGLEPTLGPF